MLALKAQNNSCNPKEACRVTTRFTVIFPNLSFGKWLINSVLRAKEKKLLFIWKGETIKRNRNKNRRKNGLKMVMFDMECVELDVLAGVTARRKCLLGS